MRFIHLADLHFGKLLHGVSLLENGDQGWWVDRFLELAEKTRPDAVLIAGDVYDRSAPAAEAVALLSRMLTGLAAREIPVLLVAGNHDSAQRLAFAEPLLARAGLYISRPLLSSPELVRVTLRDEHGPVTFWLLPYVFPALISQALGDEGVRDYDSALDALLAAQGIDYSQRNVLIAHQNVTANGVEAVRGGSETTVGGVGQIDWRRFEGFDYVALGHIHAASWVGKKTIRYAGSPLCYAFDELRQAKKGPLLVTLGAKGEPVQTEVLDIPPLHPLRELRGGFEELRESESAQTRTGEYLRLVLTDRRLDPESVGFFEELARARGSLLLDRASEYDPFRFESGAPERAAVEQKSVAALFADFYAERRGGESAAEADLALLQRAQELLERADTRGEPTAAEIGKLLEFLLGQEAEA